MKRCSECHFTFSDDEQFCDFDHTELTAFPEKSSALPRLPKGFHGLFGWFVRSRIGLSLLVRSGSAMSPCRAAYLDSIRPLESRAWKSASGDTSRRLGRTPQKKPERRLIERLAKTGKNSTQRR